MSVWQRTKPAGPFAHNEFNILIRSPPLPPSSAGGIPINALLSSLPPAAWARIAGLLHRIPMARGQVLCETGASADYIFFPITAIVSIECVMNDGRADSMALVGCDGFAGVDVFLGSGSACFRAVVLSRGWGYRMSCGRLRQSCEADDSLRALLLRYAQSYINKLALTTVCNRHHSIEQQVCRWLLMFHDRSASDELALTHEQIAGLMGVRRESVTLAAGRLQQSGCIRYHRGRIALIDRSGIESRVCECYASARTESRRLVKTSERQLARHGSPTPLHVHLAA